MAKRVLIDARNDSHIAAVAEALFDYEPRNQGKRFAEASQAIRFRLLDKAAWVLSVASQALGE